MDTQETTVFTAIIISSAVIGLIIVYFIISIVRQQRRIVEFYRQNMLSEINTLEKERTRIATDLHDELGPVLSTIKFKIDSVQSVDAEETRQLEKASNQVDSLVSRLREIAADLMPGSLLRQGLVPAVEEFVSEVSASSSLNVDFSHSTLSPLPQEANINLYRIIKEVTHNTLKHADASRLTISILHGRNDLQLKCVDNGAGFIYEKALTSGNGIGLRNLKNRAEVMGGSMQVESKAGVGTAYLFIIPLKN